MRARRGNGEGSIGKVRRPRKDGSFVELWRGRMVLPDGRRVTVYGKTRIETSDKLVEIRGNAAKGILPASEHPTVAAYLERWLQDVARPTVRSGTLVLYQGLVRRHIVPRIGQHRLERLTPAHVQGMLSELETKGASPRLREQAYNVLHRALDQALRWNLVLRNATAGVDRPRVPKKTMHVLSPEQAESLLVAARDDRLFALYVLALTTGMRQGEVLGLQWEDVDLRERSLSVRHTLLSDGGVLRLGEPKTASSRRRIELPEVAAEALRAHREQLLGEGLRSAPWVFPDTAGGPIRKENLVRRSFEPLLKRAGLSKIRFHDLRHTAATLMLLRNVPAKVVQERLGHASIALTLDTYSHVLPSMQRQAAAEMDALFGHLRKNPAG